MSELKQSVVEVPFVDVPVPPEQVNNVANEQSSNAHVKKAVTGILAAGTAAIYAVNALVPPSEGMDMSDRLAAGAGLAAE